jgi:hypothetical protein
MTPLDRTVSLSFLGTATRIRTAVRAGCSCGLPSFPKHVIPIGALRMCRFGLIGTEPNRPAVRFHYRRTLHERPALSHSSSREQRTNPD